MKDFCIRVAHKTFILLTQFLHKLTNTFNMKQICQSCMKRERFL